VIAANLLRDDFNSRAAQGPEFGEELTAAVGGLFFEAGRFEKGKLAEGLHHLR